MFHYFLIVVWQFFTNFCEMRISVSQNLLFVCCVKLEHHRCQSRLMRELHQIKHERARENLKTTEKNNWELNDYFFFVFKKKLRKQCEKFDRINFNNFFYNKIQRNKKKKKKKQEKNSCTNWCQ